MYFISITIIHVQLFNKYFTSTSTFTSFNNNIATTTKKYLLSSFRQSLKVTNQSCVKLVHCSLYWSDERWFLCARLSRREERRPRHKPTPNQAVMVSLRVGYLVNYIPPSCSIFFGTTVELTIQRRVKSEYQQAWNFRGNIQVCNWYKLLFMYYNYSQIIRQVRWIISSHHNFSSCLFCCHHHVRLIKNLFLHIQVTVPYPLTCVS